jgi:hypothetical protein
MLLIHLNSIAVEKQIIFKGEDVMAEDIVAEVVDTEVANTEEHTTNR